MKESTAKPVDETQKHGGKSCLVSNFLGLFYLYLVSKYISKYFSVLPNVSSRHPT